MGRKGFIGLRLSGSKALVKKLRRAGKRGTTALGAGLYAVGNEIMSDAKRRSPVDMGVMRASGYVTLPQGRSDLVVEVGFGGAAKDYVVVQHEDTSLNHPVGESKFLEKALRDKAGSPAFGHAAKAAFESGRKPGHGVHPTKPGE